MTATFCPCGEPAARTIRRGKGPLDDLVFNGLIDRRLVDSQHAGFFAGPGTIAREFGEIVCGMQAVDRLCH